MPVRVNKNLCPHNHICPLIKLCPVAAITQNTEGYPEVDGEKCIECGECIASCPKGAMEMHS